ncbi:MAG: fluoride efflux transporter CrcB [Burkholderiaceae bacterium]|jgi:CrcB protein|nr:fluoride efflux transporter CrcB [Burkholderiaceae bacterium]
MLASVASICAGASAGALLRWLLSASLNALWPGVPLGTLLANLLGGYLIGVAFAWIGANPALSPEMRLLVVTGFLGGLTTFSTFSIEVVDAAQRGEFGSAAAIVLLHLAGSLACTVLGIATYNGLRAA